jgi:hypothetical protein
MATWQMRSVPSCGTLYTFVTCWGGVLSPSSAPLKKGGKGEKDRATVDRDGGSDSGDGSSGIFGGEL